MKSKLKHLFAILAAMLAMLFFAEPALAATDTIFAAGVTKLTTLLTGTGGILVSLAALIAAVVAGVSGNIKTALTALAVMIIASIGPSVANSFFTAVI